MPKTEPTTQPAPSNQVLLAITRAQLHALRWLAAPAKHKPDPWPPTRVLDSLRYKGLRTHVYGAPRADQALTPAGAALLAALDLLHPQTTPRTRHDRANSTRRRGNV